MRAQVIAVGVVLAGLLGLLLATLPSVPRHRPARAGPATGPDPARVRSAGPGRLELPRDSAWAAPVRLATEPKPEAEATALELLSGTLMVRVFGPDNRALPMAWVDWVDVRALEDPEWRPPDDPRFLTDETGRVELEDLPVGPMVLFAGAPFPPPPGEVLFAWLPYTPELSPAGESEPPSVELLIRAHRKYRIRGRVLGADRAPLVGVKLGLKPSAKDGGLQRFLRPFLLEDERIDGDGHFALGLIGDAPWRLRVLSDFGPGAKVLARRRVGRADADRPLEIVLDDSATITCRLWGADGVQQPISSHSLSWRTERGGGGGLGFSSSHGSRQAVAFAWPDGATEVGIGLSTRERFGGPSRRAPEVLLRGPRDPCEAYLSP